MKPSFKYLILFSIFLTALATPVRAGSPPRKIILFIGNGMGPNQRLAAQRHSVGQSKQLVMDVPPFAGFLQPANIAGGLTDSAAGSTAIATHSMIVVNALFPVYLPFILK